MIRRVTGCLIAAAGLIGPAAVGVGVSASGQEGPAPARKVQKTDAQWQRRLTQVQFLVTRRKQTEPANTGKYAHSKAAGTYLCVCCGAPLFSSTTKFESGTGWPSFYKPVSEKMIDRAIDNELGYPRVEVMCMDCGAHLGHVFDDGPRPTGLRYCINSASLKFLPRGAKLPTSKDEASKAEDEPKAEGPAAGTEDTESEKEKPAAKPAPKAKAKGRG